MSKRHEPEKSSPIRKEGIKKQKNKDLELYFEIKVSKRPGVGTLGRTVALKANYIRIVQVIISVDYKFFKSEGHDFNCKKKFNTDFTLFASQLLDRLIYHYNFLVEPPVKTPVALTIFSKIGTDGTFSDVCPVFDGNSSIYSFRPLPIGNKEIGEKISVRLGKIKTFHVTIRKIEELELRPVFDYISGKTPLNSQIANCRAILNTIFNYKPRSTFATLKKGIFPEVNNQKPILLSGGIQLKLGLFQALHLGWDHMYLNVDVCAATFYPSMWLIDVIGRYLEKNHRDDLRRGINIQEKRKIEKYFHGVQIRVIHRGEQKRKYKIERFSQMATDEQTFLKNGKHITILEYFSQTYGKRLEYKALPCIVVKKNVLLPLEIMKFDISNEGQSFKKELSDKVKAEIVKTTAMKPQERFRFIENGIQNYFKYQEDENLQQLGVRVENQLVTVNGRVLDTPTVTFHPKSQAREEAPRSARWTLNNKIFVKGRQLVNWGILVVCGQQDAPQQNVQRFIREIKDVLREKGIMVAENQNPYLQYNDPIHKNLEEAFSQTIERCHVNKNGPPQLIICIIAKKSNELYGRIKMLSDHKFGIPSQVIIADKLRRANNRPCWQNIALKINAKLGGHNCFLKQDQLRYLLEMPTMIMGADISHPGPGTNQKSVAALCASMEPSGTTYYGRCSINQILRNETIESLEDMAFELLKIFWEKNKLLPLRILFYRDGVSDSQFRAVLNKEVIALKKAFSRICGNNSKIPTLTYIIAQKRHHTRFFPTNLREGDRNGNCQPGTVVDTMIVLKGEFDFYLQSHSGIHGTTRPTHYYVLFDENDQKPDAFQTLTYHLCFLYARCSSAISIVPPIAYAHLIAQRARLYPMNEDDHNFGNENHSETNSLSTVSLPTLHEQLSKAMYFV
ncbi:hypothetical protein G9A89_000048 [Geosiphon pyriformis]|nr:hypothetical protein G9A89_000048 [Geosiphon pyriformis]